MVSSGLTMDDPLPVKKNAAAYRKGSGLRARRRLLKGFDSTGPLRLKYALKCLQLLISLQVAASFGWV